MMDKDLKNALEDLKAIGRGVTWGIALSLVLGLVLIAVALAPVYL